MHQFPYAILSEGYDDGCRLGISISKVIDGIRKQWWLEKRSMNAVREANSLVDRLSEEVKDPKTHQWGWDRVAFFGPRSKVRSGEKTETKWQERSSAAQPRLKSMIASRKREDFDVAGSNVVPLDFNNATKRKYEEIGEEEEEEEEDEEEEKSTEEVFNAYDIWRDQVIMTRKYLKENHQQLKAQGNDAPYFKTYRTFSY